MVLLVVVVQGWKFVFLYWLGDRVDNGIVSSVYFEVINVEEICRVRDVRLLLVLFVFCYDLLLLFGVIELFCSYLGVVVEKK